MKQSLVFEIANLLTNFYSKNNKRRNEKIDKDGKSILKLCTKKRNGSQ